MLQSRKEEPQTREELVDLLGELYGNEISIDADNLADDSGSLGKAFERYLGASGSNLSEPDLKKLQCELKTKVIRPGKVIHSRWVELMDIVPNIADADSRRRLFEEYKWKKQNGEETLAMRLTIDEPNARGFFLTVNTHKQIILSFDPDRANRSNLRVQEWIQGKEKAFFPLWTMDELEKALYRKFPNLVLGVATHGANLKSFLFHTIYLREELDIRTLTRLLFRDSRVKRKLKVNFTMATATQWTWEFHARVSELMDCYEYSSQIIAPPTVPLASINKSIARYTRTPVEQWREDHKNRLGTKEEAIKALNAVKRIEEMVKVAVKEQNAQIVQDQAESIREETKAVQEYVANAIKYVESIQQYEHIDRGQVEEARRWAGRTEYAAQDTRDVNTIVDMLAQVAHTSHDVLDTLIKVEFAVSVEQATWYTDFMRRQVSIAEKLTQEMQTKITPSERFLDELPLQEVLTQIIEAAQKWTERAKQALQDADVWMAQAPTIHQASQAPISIPRQIPSQSSRITRPLPSLTPSQPLFSPTNTSHSRSSNIKKLVFLAALAVLLILGSGAGIYAFNVHQTAVNNAIATATTQAKDTATTQAIQATEQTVATAQAVAQATANANAATAQAAESATQAAQQATAQAQANVAASATAAVAYNPYPPNTGTLVINDPLSNNSMGYQWDESPTCVFTNGAYQVSISGNPFSTCTAQVTNFTSSFVYQVNITIIQGCGGITFFSQGDNFNYTYFEICQDGSSEISVCSGNSASYDCSGGGNIPPNPAIQTGSGQSNTLAVVYANDSLSFYVNQQLLQTVGSGMVSVTGGKLGLIAGISSAGGYGQVTCSNVKVWTL